MSLRENGKSFSRAVPKEEHEWITKMTDNYRIFQKLCKKTDALGKATKTLLNNYEVHVVNETKKGKSYLSVTPNQNTNKKTGSKK